MMARQNPRTGTKIEKRTRTGIIAGTVTETEGETGIGIGTRIEIETDRDRDRDRDRQSRHHRERREQRDRPDDHRGRDSERYACCVCNTTTLILVDASEVIRSYSRHVRF